MTYFYGAGGHGPLGPPLDPLLNELQADMSLSTPLPVADLRGGARDASPPGGSNSFNFMLFFGNFGKIVCWHPPEGWRPHPGEIPDPPPFTVLNVDLHVSIRAGKADRFCR